MTMLDRMRRHKYWLKWTLAAVVLAFIALYIPSRNRNLGGAAPHDELATVNGEPVTVSAYRRAYQQQVQMYRSAYGPNFNEQMLKQMGIEQQILRQLLDERAAIVEARRLGLSVSDAEVAQRILAIPAFQQSGVFAGEDAYAQVLASQRPPLTKAEFEDSLRRSLLVDKLHATLTDWMTVSDADVTAEFKRRNEKAKVDLVVLSADKLRGEVTVSDADLSAWFDGHKEDYRIGEKKKVKYLLVDVDKLRVAAVVPPGDIEKYYRDNQQEFTTPEQVRASHILIKSDKDDAAAKAKAEALLKQVKSGADFAALAKKNSEDEGSAKNGGDLDYFGRGRMVKEFEEAAFSLQPGQMSDVVKSPFGYHIIKVVDHKPAITKSIADVRQQIADRLATERAQADASALAGQVSAELKAPADLDRVAAARKLTVQESGFFLRDEPVAGLGPVPEITDQAFTAKADTVSGPVTTARGIVFFAVVGTEPSRLPQLAEVKDKVREDVTRQKARELTKTKAAALAASLSGADFAKAAKGAGLEVKPSELVSRGTAWPDVGISPALDQAVFAQPAGGVTAPVTTDAATVIAHIVEHQDINPQDLATAREGLRQELENDKRSRFFGAYMVKARDRMKIEVDQEVLRSLVG
jgi:peptidyl-prolyl cis-trans isomerase D